MKFTCTVEIAESIDKVVALWSDEKNLKHWQDGYLGMEHLSGELNKAGSTYKLKYAMRGKPFDLLETVLVYNLPKEYTATYEHIHINNTMRNSFKDLGNDKTLYVSEVEYTEFKSFMLKVMKTLMPGMFKKQVQKWMNQFKDFVEKGNSIV